MKKALIGSLVGAVLVFGWQSTAHMFMHHHDAGYKQVVGQDTVIAAMSDFFKEEGQYMVPIHDINAPQEEKEKWMKDMEGKPWAQVVYHPAMKNDMVINIIRSFGSAFLCVLILIAIMGSKPGAFGTVFLKCIGAGFFSFMYVLYNQHVWMQVPWAVVQGELIDALVSWGLCGLWLGFYLKRK